MDLDNLDIVPESTVASVGGGAERLDSDGVSASDSALIDSMLDTAEAALNPVAEVKPAEAAPAPEAQFERQVETPPVETPPTPTVIEPIFNLDPSISEIESPRNLSEKNQSNWRKLQEVGNTAISKVRELEQQLQQLQQSKPQTPADYEELRQFRAVHDIKNDPDFKSRYDVPITNAADSIYGILKKNGAPDSLIESMKAGGGPEKVPESWWQKEAIAKLPFLDAEKLKAGLLQVSDLREKQQKEIEDTGKNAEKFYAQKEEKTKQWFQEETQTVRQTLDEITKELPWARFQKEPENGTPEQIEKVKQHNAAVTELHRKFESALWPQTAQQRTAIAAAATFSHVLTEKVKGDQVIIANLQAENKKIADELSKLKSAGRAPKSNLSASSVSSKSPNTSGSRVNMNPSDAFDLGIEEAGG